MTDKFLEFQIYDWTETDKAMEETIDSDEEQLPKKYLIQVFGRTICGKSVYCKITGFTPHFYIKVSDKWKKSMVKTMVQYLKSKRFRSKKVWDGLKRHLIRGDIVTRQDAYGFHGDRKFKFVRLVFDNSFAMKRFSMVFDQKIYIPGITKKMTRFKLYESNILPMLRCFHIQDISGCGWVQLKSDDYTIIDDEDEKESLSDIEVEIHWKKINPIQKETNAPFRIASFDIECYSADGSFPQAYREADKIIQIGTTYTYLGENDPYREHIVTLDGCEPIKNAVVESFDKEEDVIKAWIKEIIENDCDIITGYNIFYFDEKYIYDRAMKLDIIDDDDLIKLSKLKNYGCRFREMKLASSAMGENLLRYWITPGRVHIDLFKDVQKTYRLPSYKLDFVSSHFIRGGILDVEKCKKGWNLKCDGINDIHIDDYIHIEVSEGYVTNYVGKKFRVAELNQKDKIIFVETDINLKEELDFEKFKVYWSQAKDDVGPKQIFAFQTQSDEKRTIVAKYCLKDCRLVNLLVNKLEVVTKNIEMANVCSVPFSYLFVRGQGIKLFSLNLKYYRKFKYLFPVVKISQNVMEKHKENNTWSYEGAIVFEPEPKLYLEAVPALDYASLYPSSIIMKNMSHETLVTKFEYDNLPEYDYYNSKYEENDGTTVNIRFAKKKSGELGVVPTILQNLLTERRNVKKLMKKEKDKFKYNILDAKQLALKITANSLYGQLGAMTSPICYREIAACTTATGREMLIFAKKYIEEIFPPAIIGMQYALKNNKMKVFNRILDKELLDPKDEKLRNRIKDLIETKIKDFVIQPVIRYGDTDSVFAAFRFREGCKKVKKSRSLKIYDSIIRFGCELIKAFLPDEYKLLWTEKFDQHYGIVDKLELHTNVEKIEQPKHWRDTLSIEDRITKFLKEYMEESFFPWFWTIQESHSRNFTNFRKKVIEWGQHLIKIMGLKVPDIPEESDLEYKIMGLVIQNLKKIGDYHLQQIMTIDKNNKIKYKIEIYKGGEVIVDKRSLEFSMETGMVSGEMVKKYLDAPQDLEYEKTYWPFLILTKKRYVGNKYEFNPNKYKQDCMGIVLKRRDNAPIVKLVCGGIINRLMDDKNPQLALQFTQQCLENMMNNQYNIKYFLQSRLLKMKESYKDWTRIAHVVLSERIGKRDPGNKPQAGDRISFAVIITGKKNALQGDIIETPEYIAENNKKIDYKFYITNQIMKPAKQFLNLAVDDCDTIFDDILLKIENKAIGRTDITDWCKVTKIKKKKKKKKKIKNSFI